VLLLLVENFVKWILNKEKFVKENLQIHFRSKESAPFLPFVQLRRCELNPQPPRRLSAGPRSLSLSPQLQLKINHERRSAATVRGDDAPRAKVEVQLGSAARRGGGGPYHSLPTRRYEAPTLAQPKGAGG
jgi:hypothetical protein